jgi:hypothetical protein
MEPEMLHQDLRQQLSGPIVSGGEGKNNLFLLTEVNESLFVEEGKEFPRSRKQLFFIFASGSDPHAARLSKSMVVIVGQRNQRGMTLRHDSLLSPGPSAPR